MPEIPEASADAHEAVGRRTVRTQMLDRDSVARFAVAVGDAPDAIPPLAHWAWFLDAVGDDALGEDGHPRRGGFLPAFEDLPRRMFAAATIRFTAPLLIDRAAEMTASIVAVRRKSGRSGDLAFVDVDQHLVQGGILRIAERRTIVYRASGEPVDLPEEAGAAGEVGGAGGMWRPGSVALFRFSAATFNAHRIHYDLPYARQVEGYPGLVVQGPLTASRLAGIAAHHGPLKTFAFRAMAPLFADQPVRLERIDSGGVRAMRCDGAIAMTAEATW